MAMNKPARRKQSLETSLRILRGDEPTVTKEGYKIQLIKALNWYNVNWEEKDYRKSAESYVVKHMKMKDAAHAIGKADFAEIRMIGALGRLAQRGSHLDLDHMQRVFEQIESLKTKYAKTKLAPVIATKPGNPIVPQTVQERIAETAHNHAGEVEGAVDAYLKEGTAFSMKSFLLQNQVSGVVAKRIGSIFEPRVKELEEALSGEDEQLKEGYALYGKRKLKQYTELMRQIVADCNQQAVSAKAKRKPRARKAKPASVIVKKMNYMKEFAPLNLKSISAEKIIGASELWVYNTISRKLIVFYGADNGYLGVSGMSITNYDVKTSQVKTLRKPEEFFKGLSSTGKRAMANAWKSIKAKTSSPRARINEDMILLAAN